MKLCPCCSGKTYDMCCQTFISGILLPQTAEQLMRSRYTAYTRCEVAYILNTTHPLTRKQYNAESIKAWAASSVWKKLEICSTKKGCASDTIGYVEFKAYYSDAEGDDHIHHEYSSFEKIGAGWLFVEGEVY
ncbi:YchJ family protein [Cytophaga aurantiaca]|uniref:YchJ family protein n=1 Tax=Cytophaga aurantiaca TaxID=29530 RepID=UPI0004779EE2|nr:YchJ family metal-binding protein [Cytophaga aurantiaca]